MVSYWIFFFINAQKSYLSFVAAFFPLRGVRSNKSGTSFASRDIIPMRLWGKRNNRMTDMTLMPSLRAWCFRGLTWINVTARVSHNAQAGARGSSVEECSLNLQTETGSKLNHRAVKKSDKLESQRGRARDRVCDGCIVHSQVPLQISASMSTVPQPLLHSR